MGVFLQAQKRTFKNCCISSYFSGYLLQQSLQLISVSHPDEENLGFSVHLLHCPCRSGLSKIQRGTPLESPSVVLPSRNDIRSPPVSSNRLFLQFCLLPLSHMYSVLQLPLRASPRTLLLFHTPMLIFLFRLHHSIWSSWARDQI